MIFAGPQFPEHFNAFTVLFTGFTFLLVRLTHTCSSSFANRKIMTSFDNGGKLYFSITSCIYVS